MLLDYYSVISLVTNSNWPEINLLISDRTPPYLCPLCLTGLCFHQIIVYFLGILMMVDIPQERGMSALADRFHDPTLCFFPLFDWLKPLPVDWMHVVYIVMFMAALGIALGFCYRSSCLMFILTYWYIFFLDKSVWNNHSYLYGLISIMLLITDANRYWWVTWELTLVSLSSTKHEGTF